MTPQFIVNGCYYVAVGLIASSTVIQLAIHKKITDPPMQALWLAAAVVGKYVLLGG